MLLVLDESEYNVTDNYVEINGKSNSSDLVEVAECDNKLYVALTDMVEY